MSTPPISVAPRRVRGFRAWPALFALLLVACGGDTVGDQSDAGAPDAADAANAADAVGTARIPTRQTDACPLEVAPPPEWALQEEPPSDGIPLRRRFTWGSDGESGATFAVEQVVGTPQLEAQRELWMAAGGRLVATPTIVGAEVPVVAGPIEVSQGGTVRAQRWFFWLPAGLPERWVILSLGLSVREGSSWPAEETVLATIESAVPGRCLEGR